MTTNLKRLRICILILPALLLATSLTQTGFTNQYHNEVQIQPGGSMFLLGWSAILGGATLEWFIWLANPLAIWSAYHFVKLTTPASVANQKIKYKIIGFSIIAAALALSFSLWKEVLASESGQKGKILSFDLGYWLWVSSISVLAFSISLYFLVRKFVI
jgi:hypothetical protein